MVARLPRALGPAGNLATLAQPGTPLAFPDGDVHQLDSEDRNRLSAYTAPDIGLLAHQVAHWSPDPHQQLHLRSRWPARIAHPTRRAQHRSLNARLQLTATQIVRGGMRNLIAKFVQPATRTLHGRSHCSAGGGVTHGVG